MCVCVDSIMATMSVCVGTQWYMIHEDACEAYVIPALPSGLETTRWCMNIWFAGRRYRIYAQHFKQTASYTPLGNLNTQARHHENLCFWNCLWLFWLQTLSCIMQYILSRQCCFSKGKKESSVLVRKNIFSFFVTWWLRCWYLAKKKKKFCNFIRMYPVNTVLSLVDKNIKNPSSHIFANFWQSVQSALKNSV